MSSLVFMNIGHDIGNVIIRLIDGLNKLREETPQLKFIVWPAVYMLKVAKTITLAFANGATEMNRRVIPGSITSLRYYFIGATPNSVYCFNKTGFLIFFADIYFI